MSFFLKWIFVEKPRGLDFSMRRKKIGITAEGSTGYAATHSQTLRKIFEKLVINGDDSFLDIGCGKGAVLRFASGYPFGRIAGLEYEGFLCRIAESNMRRLGLDGRVEIIQGDARTFECYGDYNVFFLYNPFSTDISKAVLERIIKGISIQKLSDSKRTYIICYGKYDNDTIENSGLFILDYSFIDPVKDNVVNVWKYEPGNTTSTGGAEK